MSDYKKKVFFSLMLTLFFFVETIRHHKYDDNYLTDKSFSFFSLYSSLGTLQSGHLQQSQGISCTNNPNLGGSSPLVMPVFPLRSQTGHGSQYSPYSPSRFVIIIEFSSVFSLLYYTFLCVPFMLPVLCHPCHVFL